MSSSATKISSSTRSRRGTRAYVNPQCRAQKLVTALGKLREQHKDLTVLQAQVLLLVAADPGLSQVEVCERLGVSDGAISRIVNQFSHGNDRSPGLGLVFVGTSDADNRMCRLNPTIAGRHLVDHVLAAVDPTYR